MNPRTIKAVLDALEDDMDELYGEIDGGEECRGRDGAISRKIDTLEAARNVIRNLVVERDMKEAQLWLKLNDCFDPKNFREMFRVVQ